MINCGTRSGVVSRSDAVSGMYLPGPSLSATLKHGWDGDDM